MHRGETPLDLVLSPRWVLLSENNPPETKSRFSLKLYQRAASRQLELPNL